MHEIVLKNGRIVFPERIVSADLGLDDGKISAVGGNLSGNKVFDLRGKLILPGLIDVHVHFREPGYTEKEDWASGSAAAAAGGVTTVLEMPNTSPPTTTKKLLDEKRLVAGKKSVVDFGFHFAATKDNLAEIRKIKNVASVKFFLGSSTGDLLLDDEETISSIMEVLRQKNIPATVHAEDESIIKKETGKLKSLRRLDAAVYSEARPPDAAAKAVERIISISKKAGSRLHICHISTRKELEIISENRRNVSVEVTPHHLLFSVKDYRRLGSLIKTNPPIRSELDRKALWRALNNRLIDVVASDHAPHTLESKKQDIWSAPAGVPGVETLLPLMLNEVNRGNLSINQLVELTSRNPAKIFRIRNKGEIRRGFDADLVVVDLKKEDVVDGGKLHSKCGWSPYSGKKVRGWPIMSFVRGQLVYDCGNINNIRGREVSYG